MNPASMKPLSKKPGRKVQDAPEAAPRKRRKRTVFTGAPDDCFTCAKRGAKCDRRRPYCSQCLEMGGECSGYKTKLTWNVGVASRGKLRGLSLPVMNAKPALAHAPGSSAASKDQPIASNPSNAHLSPSDIDDRNSSVNAPSDDSASQVEATAYPTPANTTIASSSSTGTLWSSDPPDERSLASACLFSQSSEPLAYSEFYQQRSPDIQPVQVPQFSFTGLEPMASYSVEDSGMKLPGPQWTSQTEDNVEEIYRDDLESTDASLVSGPAASLWAMGHTPSYSQMLLARSVGRTPRLKYLISYYAEVIAPVIVAFDSPTNPFRTYVLSLAQESEALQEAIATLSSSNLRQRRMRNTMSKEKTLPARMSSIAHQALTDKEFQDLYGITISEGLNREELHHRALAVKALNAQLANPTRRLSDSVLATLLILCLYHICDSGVAQFKTQFAGVMKLFAIRMRSLRVVSDELKWFIRIFTWFDTMTATINDRDVLLCGFCSDTTAVSDGEWSLENLVGIDAGLFKFISQLGRLNLLSQQKTLDTFASPDVHFPTAALPPSMLPYTSLTFDPRLFMGQGVVNAFGFPYPVRLGGSETSGLTSPEFWTEWFSIRQKLESWRLDTRNINMPSDHFYNSRTGPSISTTFSNPGLMSPSSSPTSPSLVAPQHLEDLYNISESFRQSALLYTERLAYPNLPSSHPRFQNIVQVALRYISAVESDVYLLWPLFITGAECVLEEHRDIIRNRCSGIENDSGFFNNLSCLELLERIWAGDRGSASTSNGYGASGSNGPNRCYEQFVADQGTSCHTAGAQGFRWQHIIRAKSDGEEYMVV